MTEPHHIDLVKIAPVAKQLNPIALGGFVFGAHPWKEQKSGLFEMLETALKEMALKEGVDLRQLVQISKIRSHHSY